MLSVAKHLDSLPDRPFAAAQGDKGTPPVMLSVAKHLDALPDRPFAVLRGTRDLFMLSVAKHQAIRSLSHYYFPT